MTERIYHLDSRLTCFRAKVLSHFKLEDGGEEVVLDRTCFHPASGGEPGDRGTIEGLPVSQVYERDQEIVHRVEGNLPEGVWVQGRIDWEYRRDIMEQHTGQHILSQAALQVSETETTSFRIGEEDSTIDLASRQLTDGDIAQMEELANEVVRTDVPVRTHFYPQDKLDGVRLRRAPEARFRLVRVVEVGEFDAIPCGGVHCASSGEVGTIAITRWERQRGRARVHFLCGSWAVADYRAKIELLSALAGEFQGRQEELLQLVSRFQAEKRAAEGELRQLRDRLLDYEAKELYAGARLVGKLRLVKKGYPDRGTRELGFLAGRLRGFPACVALLGGVEGGKAALVFSCWEELELDMRPVLRRSAQLVGGGGGGERTLARGGGSKVEGLEAALDLAEALVLRQEVAS